MRFLSWSRLSSPWPWGLSHNRHSSLPQGRKLCIAHGVVSTMGRFIAFSLAACFLIALLNLWWSHITPPSQSGCESTRSGQTSEAYDSGPDRLSRKDLHCNNGHQMSSSNAAASQLKTSKDDLLEKSPAGEESVPDKRSADNSCKSSQSDLRKGGWIEWSPAKDRYLLAMCDMGQLNNRFGCLRRLFLNAALLNRTLLLPSRRVLYNYTRLLDLRSLQDCFGPGRVVLLEDFVHEESNGGVLVVDRSLCQWPARHMVKCGEILDKYRESKIVFRDPEMGEGPTRAPIRLERFRELFGSQTGDRVVAFPRGEGLTVAGFDRWTHSTAGCLRVGDRCRYVLQPHPAIVKSAEGFVDTFLGRGQYLSLHWRRGDFFEYCQKHASCHENNNGHTTAHASCEKDRRMSGSCQKEPTPFSLSYPVTNIARCLSRQIGAVSTNASAILVVTNADKEEVELLAALLRRAHGDEFPVLVRIPPRISGLGWARPLAELGWDEDRAVRTVLDMVVAALSERFLGTRGSTFSSHIRVMRHWWMLSSCHDGSVCDD